MITVLKQPARAGALLRLPVSGGVEAAPPAPAPDAPPHAAATASAAPAPGLSEQPTPPAIDHAALQAELEALREQARRDGFAQGSARAEQELRSALDSQAQRWRSGIDAMQAELPRKLQALEPLAVAVGYEALARVLGRAYADGSGIEHAVRRLLDETASALNLRVQLAPAHLPRVQSAFAQEDASAAPAWQFEADATLGEHECRIVSERGQLETSLACQLDAVRNALLDASMTSGASALEPPPARLAPGDGGTP